MLFSPAGLWLTRRIDNHWLSVLFALTLLYLAYNTLRKARAGKTRTPVCVRGSDTGRFIWPRPCARARPVRPAGRRRRLRHGSRATALHRPGDPVRSGALTGGDRPHLGGQVATSAAGGGLAWGIALPFSAGALAGMLDGRTLSKRLSGPHLQIAFAAASAAVGVGMIAKALF